MGATQCKVIPAFDRNSHSNLPVSVVRRLQGLLTVYNASQCCSGIS